MSYEKHNDSRMDWLTDAHMDRVNALRARADQDPITRQEALELMYFAGPPRDCDIADLRSRIEPLAPTPPSGAQAEMFVREGEYPE